MRTVAHLVNPVLVTKSSDLFVAQPVTYETMRVAREFARGRVEVMLLSAQYPEDRSVIPEGFRPTPDLERSVLDFGTFRQARKLPLLADVLDRLFEGSDAEYLIFTNVDIALMPHFYIAVDRLIEEGYDALVINRRVISGRLTSVRDIPLMYTEIGTAHEGHDCFVFRREIYPRYKLGVVCIGVPWVGRALLWNLACHAKSFKECTNEHLTFHLGPGNDQAWQGKEHADYQAHNVQELLRILADLEKEHGPFEKHELLAPYVADIADVLGQPWPGSPGLRVLRRAAGRLWPLLKQ